MNRYDKEIRIVEIIRTLNLDEILFIPYSRKTKNIYDLFHEDKYWFEWTDSSKKNDVPPDFYNDKRKIMMDIMRIDDHAYENNKGKIINPTNMRESELMKEFVGISDYFKKLVNDGKVIVNPNSGLRGWYDHNYSYYIRNMQRVIEKHIKKIPLYLQNHPDYKIVFMIMDESSQYVFNKYNNAVPKIPGEKFFAIPHLWWRDNNLLRYFKYSKVDYLIWLTPFKNFDEINIQMPNATIIDMKKLMYNDLISHIEDKMVSCEL